MEFEVSNAEAAEAIRNFLAYASDQIPHVEREDVELAAHTASTSRGTSRASRYIAVPPRAANADALRRLTNRQVRSITWRAFLG
jgi:hypothetical protein